MENSFVFQCLDFLKANPEGYKKKFLSENKDCQTIRKCVNCQLFCKLFRQDLRVISLRMHAIHCYSGRDRLCVQGATSFSKASYMFLDFIQYSCMFSIVFLVLCKFIPCWLYYESKKLLLEVFSLKKH